MTYLYHTSLIPTYTYSARCGSCDISATPLADWPTIGRAGVSGTALPAGRPGRPGPAVDIRVVSRAVVQMSQVRRWCFTLNNSDDDGLFERVRVDKRLRRGIVGDECGAAGNFPRTKVSGVIPYSAYGPVPKVTPWGSLGSGAGQRMG